MPSLRFVAKALSTEGVPPSEFARTMAPHPLMYQELPHDPEYQLYNNRLTPVRFADVTADEMYWKVRREVILRHTGEMPIEFVGPDAERLANRVFPRDVSKVRVGRCSYQFACYHDGGMINDSVMLRLAADRFWTTPATDRALSSMWSPTTAPCCGANCARCRCTTPTASSHEAASSTSPNEPNSYYWPISRFPPFGRALYSLLGVC